MLIPAPLVALDPSQLISCGGSAASMSATTATTTSSVTLNANLAAMGVRTSTVNNAASGSQTEATRLVIPPMNIGTFPKCQKNFKIGRKNLFLKIEWKILNIVILFIKVQK